MYLYYTVSSGSEVEQTKPSLSLGGYKSSTRVQNGVMNNLFSDISPITLSNFNQNRYIALVLKNESGADVSDIMIYFNYLENCQSLFRVAAVDMITGSDGELQMERVWTVNSKPLNAEFFEADGVDSAVNVGDILSGEQIGLWIEMEIDVDVVKNQYEDVYVQDPSDEYRYLEKVKETLDSIGIVVSWT